VRERRRELRQQICATCDAMPKLHLARCSWRCLHPFLSLELQLLYLVKPLCAACPANSPQQHTRLSWHTLDLSGATWPDADFSPYTTLIYLIKGSLKRANQQSTIFACHIPENAKRYKPTPTPKLEHFLPFCCAGLRNILKS